MVLVSPTDPDRHARAHVVKPGTPASPGLLALLFLAALGDAANFYEAVSLIADAQPLITAFVVIALTAAAIGLAHSAGTAMRHREGKILPIVLGSPWLMLGLAAAALRWVAPNPSSSSSVAAFGQTIADDPSGAYQLMSLLLLCLYVASGALAAWVAFRTHDPAGDARRTTWRRLVIVGFRHRRHEARADHAAQVLARHRTEQDRLRESHAAAVAERRALAEELRRYARHLIAVGIGDPVATEGLTRNTEQRSQGGTG